VEPNEHISEGIIERIRLPGADGEKPDAGLKRRAVAKIETGEQRGVVAEERDRRQRRGG